MSTLTVKELAAPTGYDLKIAAGETLDLKSQGTVTMPAGSVLQVLSSTIGTNTTSTSTSWANTAIYIDITPSNTSNKILVAYSSQVRIYGWGATRIVRTDTSDNNAVIMTDSNTASGSGEHNFGVPSDAEVRFTITQKHLDSPNTTSAIRYRVQLKRYSGSGSFNVPEGNFHASITAMEVSA